MPDLTLSGNEITDAVRVAGVKGDGAAVPGGVGVWEATTQLLGHTNDFTNGEWGGYYVKAAFTAGQADPFGGTSAIKVSHQAGGGGGQSVGFLQTPTGGQGTLAVATYTVSVWLKSAPGTTQSVTFGLKDGHTAVVTVTDVWKRYVLTTPYPGGEGNERLLELFVTDSTTMPDLYIAAPQSEQKPIATPYVLATGNRGTASRAAARVQAPATLLDATQGAVVIRVVPGFTLGSYTTHSTGVFTWADSGSNLIEAYISGAGTLFISRKTPGGGQTSKGYAPNLATAAGSPLTLAFFWTATTIGVSVNGGAWQTHVDNNPNVLASTLFDIGSLSGWLANAQFDGTFEYVATFTGDPASLDPATIHAALETDTYPTYPDAAGITAAMPMLTASYDVPPVNTVAPFIT